jgi:hypothetical protein
MGHVPSSFSFINLCPIQINQSVFSPSIASLTASSPIQINTCKIMQHMVLNKFDNFDTTHKFDTNTTQIYRFELRL